MHRTIKTLGTVFMIAVMAVTSASCRNEPIEHITYSTDDAIVEHYMNIPSFDKIEYEEHVVSYRYFDIGPHEPGYKGIIYLDEDLASQYWEDYEWNEVEAEFDFDEVDVSGLGDGPWYRSSVFEHDTFKFVNVNSAYFDGEVLVFDIHTM
ncbi:MAG: hypothetical protein J6U54_18965 [Clostridiales bacterium]|nr:hypothetical protein [Clostridiales bacterium]